MTRDQILEVLRRYRVHQHYNGRRKGKVVQYAVFTGEPGASVIVAGPAGHREAILAREDLIARDLLELLG